MFFEALITLYLLAIVCKISHLSLLRDMSISGVAMISYFINTYYSVK